MCFLSESGKVMCWGGNSNGQLGVGKNTNLPFPTIVNIPGMFRFAPRQLIIEPGIIVDIYLGAKVTTVPCRRSCSLHTGSRR
jgi:hypothetical protein